VSGAGRQFRPAESKDAERVFYPAASFDSVPPKLRGGTPLRMLLVFAFGQAGLIVLA